MARGDRFFHHPTQTIYELPEWCGLSYQEVWIPTPDGLRLHGWFFLAQGQPLGTVVHCHANAGNISGHFQFVGWLPAYGWNVLCFDYRSFGRSASNGRVTREGTIVDTHAAIDYAQRHDTGNPPRIVLLGQSLGGVLALVAASQRNDLAAVVAEGPFSSYQQAAYDVCRRTWWLWSVAWPVSRWLISGGLDPIDCVDRIGPIPKLFVCGTADPIVNHHQTLALYERAGQPKDCWIIQNGGHIDALLAPGDQSENDVLARREQLHAFLRQAVSA